MRPLKMQNAKCKNGNCLRRFVRRAACVALFIAFILAVGACEKKSASEQKLGAVNKDSTKTNLTEEEFQPSAEAIARKEKSVAKLKQRNIPTIQHLPPIEDTQIAIKRTKEEIARRAIALCIVAVKGEGLEQTKIQDLIKRFNAEDYFTPAEKKFIQDPAPSQKDRVKFSWQYEGYWVMLWTLGYVDALDYPDKICDVPKAVTFLKGKTTQEFITNAKLRDLSEILDEADLIYRYDWAVVNARIQKTEMPAGLDGGVVFERHRALNWLIGYMDQEWDDVTTDT